MDWSIHLNLPCPLHPPLALPLTPCKKRNSLVSSVCPASVIYVNGLHLFHHQEASVNQLKPWPTATRPQRNSYRVVRIWSLNKLCCLFNMKEFIQLQWQVYLGIKKTIEMRMLQAVVHWISHSSKTPACVCKELGSGLKLVTWQDVEERAQLGPPSTLLLPPSAAEQNLTLESGSLNRTSRDFFHSHPFVLVWIDCIQQSFGVVSTASGRPALQCTCSQWPGCIACSKWLSTKIAIFFLSRLFLKDELRSHARIKIELCSHLQSACFVTYWQ